LKDFRFIFLRLSLYLILGILAAFYFSIDRNILIFSGIIVFVIFLLAYFRASRKIFPDAIFGISSFLLIFYLGYSAAYFSIPINQPAHYINHPSNPPENTILLASVSEELKATNFAHRYILKSDKLISGEKTFQIKGKILLNLKIDSARTSFLKPGMQVLLPWAPDEFKAPLNPFQFSYRDYMSGLQVERQINTDLRKVEIKKHKNDDLSSKSWELREQLILDLKRHNFGKNEIAVFQALILGQRREISNELYKDYAAAGAIHILAISGLHIGILLFLLNYLFKGLDRIKYGKVLKTLLLILLLWSFAVLTGLSASVVRAVAMFSFLAVGLQLKRKTSALNSLSLSLFILLLINPYYIFQVGFQLSYLAVFSIIMFQPMIYGLIKPKVRIVNYLWKMSSVSIAAQIGVLPLSLYYFHQFPGLFLATNLVILPFLGILLASGLLIIILAFFDILPSFAAEIFNFILNKMNGFIEWIAAMDSFIFNNIQFSLLQTLSFYLILIGVLLFTKKTSYRRICFVLISIFLFQISSFQFNNQIPLTETVIFHRSRQSLFSSKDHKKLSIYSDIEVEDDVLQDYIRERSIEEYHEQEIPNIVDLSGKLSLIIDSAGVYMLENFKPELLILRNSPKVNLDRLIEQLSPKQIITDGSNYTSFVTKWKITASNKKIPFHHTGEKGAYIINPEN